MNLHHEIMNLSYGHTRVKSETVDIPLDYKRGHRDARHAAAELALAVDRRVVALEDALRKIQQIPKCHTGIQQARDIITELGL
jgi:ribosome-associated translation inhibitor RaiA